MLNVIKKEFIIKLDKRKVSIENSVHMIKYLCTDAYKKIHVQYWYIDDISFKRILALFLAIQSLINELCSRCIIYRSNAGLLTRIRL